MGRDAYVWAPTKREACVELYKTIMKYYKGKALEELEKWLLAEDPPECKLAEPPGIPSVALTTF